MLGAPRCVARWQDARLRASEPGHAASIEPIEYLAHRVREATNAMGDPRRGLVWLDGHGPAAGTDPECVLTAFPWDLRRCEPEDTASLPALLDGLVDKDHAHELAPGEQAEPRFRGGWLGWIAYEAAEGLEPVHVKAPRDLGMPVASWALHPTWFRHLPAEGRLELWTRLADDVEQTPGGRPVPAIEAWCHWAEDALRSRFDNTMPMWAPPDVLRPTAPVKRRDAETLAARARCSFDRAAFEDAVHEVQHAIREGEVFQANLAHRLTVASEADPFAVYISLRRLNPSPFAVFLEEDRGSVVSNSPERLFCITRPDGATRRVELRPIAGTRPRGVDADGDAARRGDLLASPKERAEHTMLVDLVRNDAGRIAVPGTVRVAAFQTVDAYSHVHHLVSRVEATLRADVRVADVFRATFPGGTITGAPKLRSIEVIDRVERVARGPYTGSAGYINPDGTADMDILIRTLIHEGGRYHAYAGAGIVADSDSAAEYEETLHKAAAMLLALASVDPQASAPEDAA